MGEMHTIRVGEFNWHLSRELSLQLCQQFLGPDGRLLSEGLTSLGAQIIKQAPHRVVYRVVLPGLDLHIKYYRGDRRDWLRRILRGSRARREYAVSRAVLERQVPTLEVLGYGESASRLGPSESYLLTRTISDAVPLLDHLETGLAQLPVSQRASRLQLLAREVGKLVARSHRAGITHADLHPGNLLVRYEEERPVLSLIDLPAARLGRPLDWSAARENLVMLDRWFALRWSRSDRFRAWTAYVLARPELGLDPRQGAWELSRRTQLTLIRQANRLAQRSLGGNRHFRSFKRPGAVGIRVEDWDPQALARILEDPDRLFDDPRAKVLKRSGASAVIEVEVEQAGEKRVLIAKRLAEVTWRTRLASLVRPSQALHSWLAGHGLRLRGIPTARPLLILDRKRWGMRDEGYLLFEKVPNAVDLRAFLESLATRPVPERNLRSSAVLEELGRLVRSLHEWSLSHRDLKAANILVSPQNWTMSARGLRETGQDPAGRRDRVWFIDLVGLHHQRRLTRTRRVRDLARLHMSFLDHPNLTRTDRLRFLRTYFNWGLAGKGDWKKWWKEIDRAAHDKVARNVRQGRVVG